MKLLPSKYLAPLTLVALLLTTTGCNVFQRFRGGQSDAPIVLPKQSSQTDLIDVINQHSQRVRQLKTDVRIALDGMPNLRGDLIIERPDRLRLTAGLMGMSEMGFDLGSNANEFWIWKKAATPGDPPALYYANHADYQTCAIKEQLQLQPKWLLEGLGLIEFHGEQRGPILRKDGLVEITTFDNSQGTPIRVAVIDPQRGLVIRQSFYDAKGKLVACIDSIKHRYYPEHQVSLPQRVKIGVFDPAGHETKMVVDAGEYSINALFGDPERLWTMPSPPDVNKIDLTTVRTNAVQVESAPHVSQKWATFPQSKY